MSITTTWKSPLLFKLEEVETIAEEEATVTLNYTPPVILPADAKLETEALVTTAGTGWDWPSAATTIPLTGTTPGSFLAIPVFGNFQSLWLWLLGAFGLLLVSVLIIDTYQFIASQYHYSLLLGTFFLLLISVISVIAITLTWQAYQNLQTLHTVSTLQEEGHRLRETNGHGDAIHYINRIAQFYMHRPDTKLLLDRFYLMLNDSHPDRDVCQLFSTQVMHDLDQQAYRLVAQRSKETSLLVMISQRALLDTLIMLWRNVHLIRDIATLYGTRPGALGSIALIGGLLQNLIYADISEVVADATAEILGGSVLSVMSTQMAQGLGSGVLTARLGIQTMQMCRPLPFTEVERPRLKDIRREMIVSLKTVVAVKAS